MSSSTPQRGPRLPIIVLCLLGGMVFAGTAVAEEAANATTPDRSPPAEEQAPGKLNTGDPADVKAPVQTAPGMMVFIDPETGRITATPTAKQRAELQAMIEAEMARREQGPEIEFVRRPDGSVVARLHGRYQSFVGAYRLPDGSVVLNGQPLPAPSADR